MGFEGLDIFPKPLLVEPNATSDEQGEGISVHVSKLHPGADNCTSRPYQITLAAIEELRMIGNLRYICTGHRLWANAGRCTSLASSWISLPAAAGTAPGSDSVVMSDLFR